MENNNVHIFYTKHIEKLADVIFQEFLLQLPDLFQQEIKNYKRFENAQASLLGKIILLYGFKNLNLNYSLHDIEISAKDRPFVNNEFDFNISHSGNYVICAISKNAKVGIDIEKHRSLKSSVAEKYFDTYECNEIKHSPNPEKTFFDLWTLKESAIKCNGNGIEILSRTHKQYHRENAIICDNVLLYFQLIAIEKNYSCCVCSNDKFEIEIKQLDIQDLLK